MADQSAFTRRTSAEPNAHDPEVTSPDRSSGQSSSAQSMTGELRLVLVCPPQNAGWGNAQKAAAWDELGFHHPPEYRVAQGEHDALCGLLVKAGAEVVYLPASAALTLDGVYAHDASLPTDYGLILMNPAKANRVAEAHAHASLGAEFSIPIFG